MKKIQLFSLSLVLMLASFGVSAQENLKMQSVFVYNFTRMMGWPAAYQSGDFVIAVYGNSAITNEFHDLASTRTVGNQKIVVKQFNSIEEISKCHIIYVPANQSRHIAGIVDKARAGNINAMIVSDSSGATRHGSVVNFVLEGGRQRYELSERNARAMGLTVGAEMSRLAIVIN